MTDPPDGRDTPCVGVCNTLYADTCQGCGRTAQEEFEWVTMTAEQKDAVWARLLAQGWKPRKGVMK